MKWSYFLKHKDDQVGALIDFIKALQAKKSNIVKFICCDNAGENKSLEKACLKEGLGITFEYTARATLQQNGKVERNFATLYGRMRSMMIFASFTKKLKHELWTEAASTATKLDNILVDKPSTDSPYKLFYNKDPDYKNHLQIFGELGTVTWT